MARTISCDAFSWFLLLSVGLVLIAARLTRGYGRPPNSVIERIGNGLRSSAASGGNGCLPTGFIERGVGRLTETGPGCGRQGGRESGIPGLEEYARQFEEAIEKIRLRQQRFRRQRGR